MTTEPRKQIKIKLAGENATLRGDGTVWLPKQAALLVADLHLGKDAAFRAAGIPVPAAVNQGITSLLSRAINDTGAHAVYILGDLIHNRDSINQTVIEEFARCQRSHPQVDWTLILGNHDRHVKTFPDTWKLDAVDSAQLGDLELRHRVSAARKGSPVQVGGHLHPVVRLGSRRDPLRCRCFVVESGFVILPALGPFKGGARQAFSTGRQIFAIAENRIWEVRSQDQLFKPRPATSR